MRLLAAIILSSLLSGYVNPFIGTTNFGATNPGAVCPNGMMSVSPFNVMGSDLNTWDKDSRWWSTPYTYENRFFTGFSHVNLSGVGCPEVGIILTMPTSGSLNLDYHLYGSEYSEQKASPGYYSCLLDSYGIHAEASATLRSSIERYTFPKGEANIIVNLGEGLTNESGAYLRRVSDTEIEGMKLSGSFCYTTQAVFPVYFVVRVSRAPKAEGFYKKQRPMTAEAQWDPDEGKYKKYTSYEKEIAGDDIGYWFSFGQVEEGEQILLQVGVSFVSTDNARMNLDAEQGHSFNFEKVLNDAESSWESDLSRIRVEGGTEDQKTVFYTALYHTLIHPSIISDVNGDYPMMESGKTGNVGKDHKRYSVFSLWDTCRNEHQLLTLLFPDRQTDMVRSMVDMYKEWGWMPKWELFGRETFTMEGDPSIPVIVDSYLKGIDDFDIMSAYEAFIKSAITPGKDNKMRPDIDPYIEKGYIPLGFFAQDFSGDNSVSHALEYYMADNALSLLCSTLAEKTSDPQKRTEYLKNAEVFRQRSLGYRNYYSAEYGSLRPIDKNGKFLSPFNPEDGADFSNAPGFHEGSAWNYTFHVPHDIEGYAKFSGGDKAFVKRLQTVFDEGLFDPANEPDISYPYIFSRFKGEEWRTQKTVKEILEKNFRNSPDGIPGNDDTGTMSAWAIFSMMGFYPDCPGEPYYTLTSPTFDKITITLDPEFCNGHSSLVITKNGQGKEGYDRISSMKLRGKTLSQYRIHHKDLTKAGTLDFKIR